MIRALPHSIALCLILLFGFDPTGYETANRSLVPLHFVTGADGKAILVNIDRMLEKHEHVGLFSAMSLDNASKKISENSYAPKPTHQRETLPPAPVPTSAT